ncbi:Hypothetical protein SCF082_LOCUS45705 [Durusdinium trenchii]|uniref:Uncharacterized protein n=1 Tax=Durusdinium trenchii TaxID=1381693 RepID=A0ABP0RA22_9DINO
MQAFEVELPPNLQNQQERQSRSSRSAIDVRRRVHLPGWIGVVVGALAILCLIWLLSGGKHIIPLKAGSGVPGDKGAYVGIISKFEGMWCLSGLCGRYSFDPQTGWLESSEKDGGTEKVGRFLCKKIQDAPLKFVPNDFSKLTHLHMVSSEVMFEIQKEENAKALFVLPSQMNGAEYPSHTSVVEHVDDYKKDDTGGPRGQLASHPAVAQFLLDNAANAKNNNGGINAIHEIADIPGFELVNGYLNVKDTYTVVMHLEQLEARLNTLRTLVMEDVPARGLKPDLKGFSRSSHKVGLVYASAVPVDAYVNKGGDTDYQIKVAELILLAQYYGALKYAAEKEKQHLGPLEGRPPRKVFLMPLGGGAFKNPWEIIGKSMAKAVQMLDEDSLRLLDISALTFDEKPSEETTLKQIMQNLQPVQGPHCIQSAAPRHVGEFRDWLSGKGRPLADGLVADRAALGISKADIAWTDEVTD